MLRVPYNKTVQHTVTFRDDDGVLVDPTTVTIRIQLPDNTVQTFQTGGPSPPINVSPGVYRANHKNTVWGVVEWEAEGVSVNFEGVMPRREYLVEKPISAT